MNLYQIIIYVGGIFLKQCYPHNELLKLKYHILTIVQPSASCSYKQNLFQTIHHKFIFYVNAC